DKLIIFTQAFPRSHTLLHPKSLQGNERRNVTNGAVPRVFIGEPVLQTEPAFVPNATRAPGSSPSLPALRLLSNSTAEYLRGALSTRVIPVIYTLVVTFGVPANVLILCALASKIRKVSSAILYCSLAVSDLFLLLSLVFRVHYHLHGNHWALGEAACRATTACFYGNLYCSATTLACIAVKRYLAVVHPFSYRSPPRRTCTAAVTLAVWSVFAAAVVPQLLVRQSYALAEPRRVTCHDVLPLRADSHRFLLHYHVALAVLGLVLPLVVSVFCYVRIMCELNRSHLDWATYIRASSLVFAIFLLCFTPAGVLHLLHHLLHHLQLFADGTESLYVHFNVVVCLCCLHACLDPFLFLLMSKIKEHAT
uniref:Coagulation factor II thrombin receptor like 2 n=1 Tax=Echeneis naucrates TaxID=173247 RepID=A0A665X2C7_ECHNA